MTDEIVDGIRLKPTKLVDGERIELTKSEIDARQTEIDAYVAPIPQSVSMAQARLALLDVGRLEDVETTLNAMSEPDRAKGLIEWEFQTVVHRDRDLVLNVLGVGLNMVDSEIDDLFILAASL